MKRWTRLVARRHRAVLIATVVVFLGLAGDGVGVFGAFGTGGQVDPRAPSSQAEQLINDHFGGSAGLIVLVSARSGTVDSAQVSQIGQAVTSEITSQPYASQVQSYFLTPTADLRSTDKSSAVVLAKVDSGPDATPDPGVDSLITRLEGASTEQVG